MRFAFPPLFPKIEEDLYKELLKHSWFLGLFGLTVLTVNSMFYRYSPKNQRENENFGYQQKKLTICRETA